MYASTTWTFRVLLSIQFVKLFDQKTYLSVNITTMDCDGHTEWWWVVGVIGVHFFFAWFCMCMNYISVGFLKCYFGKMISNNPICKAIYSVHVLINFNDFNSLIMDFIRFSSRLLHSTDVPFFLALFFSQFAVWHQFCVADELIQHYFIS